MSEGLDIFVSNIPKDMEIPEDFSSLEKAEILDRAITVIKDYKDKESPS